MKRVDLVCLLEESDCVFARHGGRHDWNHNPATGMSQPVPRHREIKEHLVRRILVQLTRRDDDANEP